MAAPIRALILGDRRADADLLVRAMKREGLGVTAQRVTSETAFRDRLRSMPDVVLADFNLPGFNALEALDVLYNVAPDIPLVVVSAALDEDTVEACLERGAVEVVFKDELARLGEVVRQALEAPPQAARPAARPRPTRAGEADPFFEPDTELEGLEAAAQMARQARKGRRPTGPADEPAPRRRSVLQRQVDEAVERHPTAEYPPLRDDAPAAAGGISDRYERLLQTAGDAIILFDAVSGHILECNARAAEMLGKPVRRLTGQPRHELFPEETADAIERAFKDGLRRGTFQIRDTGVLHQAGHVVNVDITGSVFEADGRRYMAAIFHELPPAPSEDPASAQAAFLRSALSAMPSTAIIIDDSGRPVFVGPNSDAVLGYSEHELRGMTTLDPVFGAGYMAEIAAAATGALREQAVTIHDGAGFERKVRVSVRRVNVHGGTRLLACQLDDAHAPEDADVPPLGAGGGHPLAVASLDEAVLATDDDGILTYVSRNVERVFGFDYDTVSRLDTVYALLPEDLFDPVELESAQLLTDLPCVVTGAEGEKRTVTVTVKRASVGGGTRLYTCRDISAEAALEEALAASEWFLEYVGESITEAVIVAEPEGKVRYVSANAHVVLGLAPGTVEGIQHISELLEAPYFEELEEPVNDLELEERQCRVTGTDGIARTFLLACRPARSAEAQGLVTYVLSGIDRLQRVSEELGWHETLLAETFNTIHEAVFAADETGTLVYLSPNARGLAGPLLDGAASLDDLFTRCGQDALDLSSLEIAGEAAFETSVLGGDGTRRAFAVRLRRLDHAGTRTIGACRDITALRDAEAEASVMAERLEAATGHGAAIVLLIGDEGAPVYVSPNVESILGMTETAFLAQPETGAILQDRRDAEFALVDAGGTTRQFVATFEACAHGGASERLILTEVTSLRAVEDALTATEQVVNAIAQTLDRACVLARGDGSLAYVSANAEALLGYTAQELLGMGSVTALPVEPALQRGGESHFETVDPIACTVVDIAGHNRELLMETVLIGHPGVVWQGARMYTFRETDPAQHLEAELEARGALFNTVVHAADEAVLITDAAGRFTYVSPAVKRVLGRSAAEVQAMASVGDIFGEAILLLDAPKPGEIRASRCEVRGRGGRRMTLDVRVQNTDMDGGGLVYTCRDATEQAELEASVRTLETELDTILAIVPAAIAVADESGAVQRVSAAALAGAGIAPAAQLAGLPIEALFGQHASTLADGASPMEMDAAGPDGTPRVLSAAMRTLSSGQRIYAAADCTALRELEVARDRCTTLLEGIGTVAGEAFVTTDGQDRITYASPTFHPMLGHTADDDAGPTTLDEHVGLPSGYLAGQGEDAFEIQADTPAGPRTLAVQRQRLTGADGGMLYAFRDITRETELAHVLDAQDAFLHIAMAEIDEVIVAAGRDGRIAYVSNSANRVPGFAETFREGASLAAVFAELPDAGPAAPITTTVPLPGGGQRPVEVAVCSAGETGYEAMYIVRDLAGAEARAESDAAFLSHVAAVIERLGAAALVAGVDGTVAEVLPGSETLFGGTAPEPGANVYEWLPELPRWDAGSPMDSAELPPIGLDTDVPLHAVSEPLDGGRRRIVIRAAVERAGIDAARGQQAAWGQTLARAANAAAQARSVSDLLDAACAALVDSGFRLAWAGQRAEAETLEVLARAGAGAFLELADVPHAAAQHRDVPEWQALALSAEQCVHDAWNEAVDMRWRDEAADQQISACLAVPLPGLDGVFAAYAGPNQPLDGATCAGVRAVAACVSAGLARLDAGASASGTAAAIDELHERYAAVLDAVDAALAIVDAAGRIEYINRRCADFLETPPDTAQGQRFADLLPIDTDSQAGRHTGPTATGHSIAWTQRPAASGNEAAYTVWTGTDIGPWQSAANQQAAELARFQAALAACPDPLFIAQTGATDDAHLTDASAVFCRLLEQDAGDILGRSLFDVVPIDPPETLQQAIADARATGAAARSCELVPPSGDRLHAAMNLAAFPYADSVFLIGTLRTQSTGRQEAQALSRQYEAAAWRADAALSILGLAHHEVDKALEALLAQVASHMGADRALVFLFFDDGTLMEAAYEAVDTGHVPVAAELRETPVDRVPWLVEQLRAFRTVTVPAAEAQAGRDEQVFWEEHRTSAYAAVPMAYGNTLVGYLMVASEERGTAWDATDTDTLEAVAELIVQTLVRKQSDEALRGQLRRHETLFRALPQGLVIANVGGRIVEANPAFHAIAGLAVSEAAGRYLEEFEAADRSGEWRQHLVDAEAQGHHTASLRLAGDGQAERHVNVTTVIAQPAAGNACFYSVVIDCTAQDQLAATVLDRAVRHQWRLSQEIHDRLVPLATGVKAGLGQVETACVEAGMVVPDSVHHAAGLAGQLHTECRAMVRMLAPVSLQPNGLIMALQDLADWVSANHPVACRFTCDEPIHVAEPFLAAQLYHIASEGVANAVNHGQPQRVGIALTRSGQRVNLFVQDDGTGLPADARERGGQGIAVMEYRARLIGGALRVQPRRGGGTVVRCSVILPEGA